jgi:hypothetical protein
MKPSLLKSATTYAGAAVITAILALGLTRLMGDHQRPSFIIGVMPTCESRVVRDLLVRAVHQSPRAQQSGLRIIELGDVEDYARDATPRTNSATVEIRSCKAVAFTNAGQGDLHFILKWLNSKKDQIWLEITVSTI